MLALLELIHELICKSLVGLSPYFNDTVVSLFLCNLSIMILTEDHRLLLISVFDEFCLLLRNDHVGKTDCRAEECCIFESEILYRIEKLDSNGWLACMDCLTDDLSQLLIAEAVVLIRNTLRDSGIEDYAARCCCIPARSISCLQLTLLINNLKTFLEAIIYLLVVRNGICVDCSFNLSHCLESLDLPIWIEICSLLCEIEDTENHIL